jgi:predicted transcriptional regulator
MSDMQRVISKLQRKKAWQSGYLDELVDSTTRLIMNDVNNKGRTAQVKFLLDNGWSVNEIVSEGKRIRTLIVKHVKGMHK